MFVGYSFWGFLGDKKYDVNHKEVSTPDGNAFYSWSIINAFREAGHTVKEVMPNRDLPGYEIHGNNLFKSWCSFKRASAYCMASPSHANEYFDMKDPRQWSPEYVWDIWRASGLNNCDFILHEWRMCIPGRNDFRSDSNTGWQPDLWLQSELIRFCRFYSIPLVVFDLDYKLTPPTAHKIADSGVDLYVIELGHKWEKVGGIKSLSVEIPFDFTCIDEFPILANREMSTNLVYVGNRYERDWCVDKYIPKEKGFSKFYGNWKEGGRDSESRWPFIDFGPRIASNMMRDVYSRSKSSILMAKKDYCDNGFMTARIIECVFYGTLPIFISEFGDETIKKYAGDLANDLTVYSSEDVKWVINKMREDPLYRAHSIAYLRKHLSFMDSSKFVSDVIGFFEGEE